MLRGDWKTQKQIFITGLFRSGTTLLTRAISTHPSVHVSYQPLTPLFKMATLKFLEHKGTIKGRPLGDPLIVEHYLREFSQRICDIPWTNDDIKILQEQLLAKFKEDNSEKDTRLCELLYEAKGSTFTEIVETAFRIFKQYIRENTSKEIIGIKEVWCEDFLPTFINSGFKCIHVIRDPRGIIASRNYGKYLDSSCGGRKYPILFIARAWRRSSIINNSLNNNKNYLVVRYEDFLLHTKTVLEKICDFLHVNFVPEMQDFSKFKGGNGCVWKGNVDSERFSSIDASKVDSWKSIVSEDDMFLCEFLCGDEMKHFGYETTTKLNDVRRFWGLSEDKDAEGSWLAEFNHLLNEREKGKEVVRKGLNFES